MRECHSVIEKYDLISQGFRPCLKYFSGKDSEGLFVAFECFDNMIWHVQRVFEITDSQTVEMFYDSCFLENYCLLGCFSYCNINRLKIHTVKTIEQKFQTKLMRQNTNIWILLPSTYRFSAAYALHCWWESWTSSVSAYFWATSNEIFQFEFFVIPTNFNIFHIVYIIRKKTIKLFSFRERIWK